MIAVVELRSRKPPCAESSSSSFSICRARPHNPTMADSAFRDKQLLSRWGLPEMFIRETGASKAKESAETKNNPLVQNLDLPFGCHTGSLRQAFETGGQLAAPSTGVEDLSNQSLTTEIKLQANQSLILQEGAEDVE